MFSLCYDAAVCLLVPYTIQVQLWGDLVRRELLDMKLWLVTWWVFVIS